MSMCFEWTEFHCLLKKFQWIKHLNFTAADGIVWITATASVYPRLAIERNRIYLHIRQNIFQAEGNQIC